MTTYKIEYAKAEGATPQERIIGILKTHGIALRVLAHTEVTLVMVYDGFIITDEDGAYLDMLS